MDPNTYSTTEILRLLDVRWWRLEHLIRSGRVKPISRGRGVERRFSREEFEKAEHLLTARTRVTYDAKPEVSELG